jgi:hypothetical protein
MARPTQPPASRDPEPREYHDMVDGSPTIAADLAETGVTVALALPYSRETIRLTAEDARAFGNYLIFLADNAA